MTLAYVLLSCFSVWYHLLFICQQKLYFAHIVAVNELQNYIEISKSKIFNSLKKYAKMFLKEILQKNVYRITTQESLFSNKP